MKNSKIFWNGFAIAAQILLPVFYWKAALVINVILGFFMLIIIIEDDHHNAPFFVDYNAISLAALIIFGITEGLRWIYKNTVKKFNNWLDSIDFSKSFKRKKQEENVQLNHI